MDLAKALRFWGGYASSDPIGMPRFLLRRVREAAFRSPRARTEIEIRGVRLPLDMSLHILMKKYYFRTHEMYLERVFRRTLSSGAIFVDIGANCGYWSAFAASIVGPMGQIHMFEPVKRYAQFLREMQQCNPTLAFFVNECALGDKCEEAVMEIVTDSASNFTNFNVNTGSNSLLPGFHRQADHLVRKTTVAVKTLDSYIAESRINIDHIALIKIDVEGFEGHVLDGASQFLAHERKVPLLIEITTAPERNSLLDGAKIVARLKNAGYECLDATTLEPIERRALGVEENILCLGRKS